MPRLLAPLLALSLLLLAGGALAAKGGSLAGGGERAFALGVQRVAARAARALLLDEAVHGVYVALLAQERFEALNDAQQTEAAMAMKRRT